MKSIFLIPFVLVLSLNSISQGKWTGNTSPNYFELVNECKEYAKKHSEIQLFNMGDSDSGLPIYLLIVNGSEDSTSTFVKARNSTSVLVNNAIHPGEPDGVNAMLIWLEQWVLEGKPTKGMPTIAFIPAYNVGGMMRRGSSSRANQDGPEEYGFRGNVQNLDLNRDFIKMDSKNAFTFAKIYQSLDPDVFIDNHVSNGADYQYTLTLISTLRERMDSDLGDHLYEKMLPELESKLTKRNWPMIPYVNTVDGIPDNGIASFNDLGRYAMGYAALFDCFSFTVETHMLKPFPQRVQATLAFFEEMLKYCTSHSSEIEMVRAEAKLHTAKKEVFKYNYELDTSSYSMMSFMGFAAKYKKSEVTGMDRLYYDREEPYTKMIRFYNRYTALDSVFVPAFYLVKKQSEDVIRRLKANGVEMNELKEPTAMEVFGQHITDYKSPNSPYEGHFLHSKVKSEMEKIQIQTEKGDIIVYTNQPKQKFINSVLMAEAEDSYFAWNLLDEYMGQKEYFSLYVFEDIAAEMLKTNDQLRADFEKEKTVNRAFASSQWLQLMFIYKRSEYYEKTDGLLPVYLGMD